MTDSGREFFWRNGNYVNPDGSAMEVPGSVNEILTARGLQPIERQPSEADSAGLQMLEGMRTLAALSPGAWLHVGQVRRSATSKTGIQANVNVSDRSAGFTEYYMVRFTYFSGNPVAAFQISDFDQDQWVPNLHFKYQVDPDYYKSYWDKTFSTANGPVWKNIKMVRNTAGNLDVYLDGGPGLNYNLYWPNSLSSIYTETQVEIANNSRYTVPHDPANHFAAIKLRESNYSTWGNQTGTVANRLWLKEVATGAHVTPAYTRFEFLANNYDWMMRP